MKKVSKYVFSTLLIGSLQSRAVETQVSYIQSNYGSKVLNLRLGIMTPTNPIVGDILYVHGFGDRFDNHNELFQKWVESGFRVISFDLPSHGENSGSYNNLNNFSFIDLAKLAAQVEQHAKSDSNRPLILSGWSTGGLVVVRALQEGWTSGFSRPVSGAILFAPGVSVRKFPWTFGNRLGKITDDTLTHNTALKRTSSIKPDSPFWNTLAFKFSPRLVLETGLSQKSRYPVDIPTVVYTGGDREDMYAKAWVIRNWVKQQNYQRIINSTPLIKNISCTKARHELDNEMDIYGGEEIRKSSAHFATAIVENKLGDFSSGRAGFGEICKELPF